MTDEVTDREGVEVSLVHILDAGRALCGQLGVPRDWPNGEYWIPRAMVADHLNAHAPDDRLCRPCLEVWSLTVTA